MSAVNESIVREYFEYLGYLVSQPRKYAVPGRAKTAEEEMDLIVAHPLIDHQRIPDHVIWTTGDLKTVSRAVIGVRGWHTERFSATTFEQAPDILRFAEEESFRFATSFFGTESVAKVLCLPQLPASRDLREKAIEALRKKGIDGVLSFRMMLLELIGWVDANKNYEKSDILQTIRILKAYRLFAPPQMELFGRRAKARRAAGPGPAATEAGVDGAGAEDGAAPDEDLPPAAPDAAAPDAPPEARE